MRISAAVAIACKPETVTTVAGRRPEEMFGHDRAATERKATFPRAHSNFGEMVTPFTGAPDEVRERLEALARSPDSLTLIPPRTGGTLAGERVHAFRRMQRPPRLALSQRGMLGGDPDAGPKTRSEVVREDLACAPAKLQRHIGPATRSPIAVTARLRDQEM